MLLALGVLALVGLLFLQPTQADTNGDAAAAPDDAAHGGAGDEAEIDIPPAPEDPDAIAFFENEVRPILVERCVQCHGGEDVEGGLSFATRESLIAGGDSGSPIDFEQFDHSLFVEAISYTNVAYEMPPTGKMPEAEIETLTRWVAMGLPWTPGEAGYLAAPEGEGGHTGPMTIEEGRAYWAYRPLVRPEVPAVDDPLWSQNPIDAFIYAQLAENGLEPNEPADRVTLIRRAAYNLTGLPPTPEQVESFINDDSPDAWATVIQQYLASEHYGEAWARHWMDIVRYAETNGYERDGTKQNIWRYRDYLIRAFNDDVPYDQFIREQVAGDLLPDRDADSYIATGFLRLQVWDDEPTDRVQARADYISDIVDVTSGAFLGSTIGCARCHDHKIDPFLASDFYGLYAFFNNLREPQRGNNGAITIPLSDDLQGEQQAALEQWEARVAELRTLIAATEQAFRDAVDNSFARTELEPIAPDSRGEPQPWRVVYEDPGEGWHVQQFDDRAWPTGNAGFGYGVERDYLHTSWESDAIYLRRNFRVTEIPQFLTLTVSHKGPTSVYINGILVYQSNNATGPHHQQVQLPAEALTALVVGSNSIAVSSRRTPDALWFIDIGVYSGVVNERVALAAAIQAGGEAALGAQAMQAHRSNVAELERLLANPINQPYPAMIATELGRNAPDQNIHERGNAHAAGEVVPPSFPQVLNDSVPDIPELPEGMNASGQRLVLADWLASPDNPLTARVMVNRIWQFQFGRGIVRSASDFGSLGEAPTHPELLDWLAAEFIESGWSVKHIQELIMSSMAYQMSSSAQESGLAQDPNNNLFWRFDMRRLTAEEYRDSLLAVNGSLNPEMFGPSFYTIMPPEVLATASRPNQAWGNSSEEQRDRRSIYIFIKRSLREPLLAALDQASTDSPCPVRFVTTVPTQSLITLNSDAMQVESAEFAQRLIDEAGDSVEAQIRLGLTLVLCRPPTDAEVADNVAFIAGVMEEHGLTHQRALELFCLVAYNLNEFLYLD